MADYKNQHYIPQFYLRGFSSNEKQISLFNFKRQKFVDGASIADQCSKKDFYKSKAREKAEQMASQLGVKLGKVVSFSENFYTPYFKSLDFAESGMGGVETPDIQTGENKISVSVVITYEIY